VFYLGREEKRGEVRAHFAAMGATKEDDVRLFIDPAPADVLTRLRAAAEEDRPSLIIVDPLRRLLRLRDSNDYAEVTRALDPVLTLARQTGVHLMLVHHLGRGERSGGDAILGDDSGARRQVGEGRASPGAALCPRRRGRKRDAVEAPARGEWLVRTDTGTDASSKSLSKGPMVATG